MVISGTRMTFGRRKFAQVFPWRCRSEVMLLLTLLAVLACSVVAGVLLYAIHSAADGREDEAGFHFTDGKQSVANPPVEAHAGTIRS